MIDGNTAALRDYERGQVERDRAADDRCEARARWIEETLSDASGDRDEILADCFAGKYSNAERHHLAQLANPALSAERAMWHATELRRLMVKHMQEMAELKVAA